MPSSVNMLEETFEDFKNGVNLGELSSVPLDTQMKIISWFLFQVRLYPISNLQDIPKPYTILTI